MADQHDPDAQHDQPERYGGDGLDFDRDRLTLRFENPGLERAFQVDLGSRLLLQLRVGLSLAIGLWITTGLLLILIYGVDPPAIALAVSPCRSRSSSAGWRSCTASRAGTASRS